MVKKKYELKFDKDPKLIEDIRIETREQKIVEKFKKFLKIDLIMLTDVYSTPSPSGVSHEES